MSDKKINYQKKRMENASERLAEMEGKIKPYTTKRKTIITQTGGKWVDTSSSKVEYQVLNNISILESESKD